MMSNFEARYKKNTNMQDEISQQMRQFADKFKEEFKGKFGYYPEVYYLETIGRPKRVPPLEDIENIINSCNPSYKPPGIREHVRDQCVVLYRHIFFYFGKNYGYSQNHMRRYLDNTWSHSTISLAIKGITQQLEIKDPNVTRIVQIITEKLNFRLSEINEKT